MSGISTSIELYDRVSAPIYSMLRALDNLTSAFETVETSMDGCFDASQIEETRRLTEQAAMEVVRLGNHIDNNGNSQNEFNQSVHEGTSYMSELAKNAMGLVGAYVSLQTVSKVLDISDDLTQTTARINMMNQSFNEINGTAMETSELVDLTYQSAQDARGSFDDMAGVVAKFGNNARDAFSSQEEVVAFANLVQKQMTIAGASTEESANAMFQLSQALGSGVLRGDELNSIFEQAPNLVQSVADYLNVPLGKIREMASEGQLSADIVKNAIFSASDEINAQFEDMPMTWDQIWTSMKNGALMQFQPVLQKINDLANNEGIQEFVLGVIEAFAIVSTHLIEIMELAGMVGSFISENWSTIEPIITGIAAALVIYNGALITHNAVMAISNGLKAIAAFRETVHAASLAMARNATFSATVAQYGFNAALLACPLTWILIAIIAVITAIYVVVAAINEVKGTTISATGVIVGVLAAVVAFIWNLIVGVINAIIQFAWTNFVEPFIGIIEFILNVCNGGFNSFGDAVANLIGQIISWFLSLGEVVTKIIDAIFGTDWTSGLNALQDKVIAWGKNENAITLSREAPTLQDAGIDRWSYTDAYNSGYDLGEGIEASISDMFSGFQMDETGYGGYDASQIPSNIASTADSTGKVADSMEITSEDLKYLRDIAERDTVNRFTTAEIKIEMTNNNSISSDMDLDGVVDYLVSGVNDAMEKAAEGVHE